MADDDEDLWPLFHDLRRPPRPGQDGREQRVSERMKDMQSRGHPAPRRVRSLSRDEIVKAAIKVADAEGAEAVNMRRIARELNAGAMSLYWHVVSKEELLDLMLDAVEGEQEFPAATGDWRADLTAVAVSMRAGLLRHEWLMDFIGGRPPLGPNTLRNLERFLALISGLGLDIQTELNVLGTVATYVMGTVLREFRERRVERRDAEVLRDIGEQAGHQLVVDHLAKLKATGRFPHFVGMFEQGIDPDSADTRDERFEFGLRCVLDGIAARLAEAAAQSG